MLKRDKLGAITVSTHLGTINFDEKGESHDLSDNQQKSLAERIPAYTYIEDKPKAKPQAKAEPKEEPKEEDKPKTATRKAPARKTATKATTAKKEETKEEDEK